jgi:hypothetical protein
VAAEYSPLTLVLAELLECGYGVAATVESRGVIELAVSDHDLDGDKAPAWLFEFLSRILHRRMTPRTERYKIPSGYPRGENGLCNVLLDIEQAFRPLGLDDYGEDMKWPIPGLGLEVSIIREGNSEGCDVVIRPAQS